MNKLRIDKLDSDQEAALNKLFMKVQVNLVEEVGQSAFKSWLSSLRLNKIDNNILYLSLPSSFLSDWVIPHYGNKIDTICKRVFVGIKKTKIIVNSKFKDKSNSLRDFVDLTNKNSINYNGVPSPLDPRFNFRNFVVGKSNEFAFAAAKKVAEINKVSFNPLFLFGGVAMDSIVPVGTLESDMLIAKPSQNHRNPKAPKRQK